jgi:hypothetical protein
MHEATKYPCFPFRWPPLAPPGQNARQAYPYTPGALTDQLLGRCFARNLNISDDAPSWLRQLNCGLGPYCAQSSAPGGGPNKYKM